MEAGAVLRKYWARRPEKRRSLRAGAAEAALHMYGSKKAFIDPEACQHYIEEMREENKKEVRISPLMIGTLHHREEDFEGMQLFTINSDADNPERILYLHGGSYITQAITGHWFFLSQIAAKLDIQAMMPAYPLAPDHQFEETYKLLDHLYTRLSEEMDLDDLTIMGDSAGGGLAAGFCEHLAQTGRRQPGHLILLSPWLDISMSNPDMAEIEPNDPMLGIYGLREMGRLWAGDTDPKDYRLSPLFGDVSGLRSVLMFTGTREIFYPDIWMFYQKLKAAGVFCEFHIGDGLNHVYPIYPIPEGALAEQRICEVIDYT